MWNIYLYFIILKLFTYFQNMIFFIKIVANASLNIDYKWKIDKLVVYCCIEFLNWSRDVRVY